jgi:SSS family solute:Na+ symporter
MAPNGVLLADNAYSAILSFLPSGLRGMSLAALTAAIVASLAGKANSISTIFTLDIYQKYIRKDASEKQLVWAGRVTILIAMLVSIALTWQDTLGIGAEGGFTFIQKYTGYLSPGIFAVFILGFFWKRTTGSAAVIGILASFALAILFNNYAPALFGNDTFLYTAYPNGNGSYEIPFLICMGWTFVFTILLMVAISLTGPAISAKAFQIDASMFRLAPNHIALITVVMLIISALYVRFW